MKAHRESEQNRTQFQIDRIAFFSDAVIAIALTLMILEVKIPEFGKDTPISIILSKFGGHIAWHIFALLIGFLTIGNLWIRHHRLFEHIINYNESMIRINLYFLFSVMLLPISIQFLFSANQPPSLKYLFYFFNLSLTVFTYILLINSIFSKKNHFSSIRDKNKIDKIKHNAYRQFSVFMIATILIPINVRFVYIIPVLFLVQKIYPRIKTRLTKREETAVEKT